MSSWHRCLSTSYRALSFPSALKRGNVDASALESDGWCARLWRRRRVAARGDLSGGMQICLQSCRSFQSPGQPAAAAGPRPAKRPGTAGKLAMEGRRHTTTEVLSRRNLEYGHSTIFALRRPREVLWADQKDSPHATRTPKCQGG